MMQFTFCPRLRCFSLTVFILLVNTVIFGICVKEGIVKEGSLLQVRDDTLVRWGAMVPVNVRGGEFWLLFTSIFVSYDFLQYFLNSLFIVILCSSIEEAIGALATTIIYVGGGMLGALFGAMVHCCTEQPYVETQAAIYALLGSIIGVKRAP
jgi:membrane associated rhomboid family serine protease